MVNCYLEVWKVLPNQECVNLRTYPDFMLADAKKYCRWLESKDQCPVLYKVSREEVEFDDR